MFNLKKFWVGSAKVRGNIPATDKPRLVEPMGIPVTVVKSTSTKYRIPISTLNSKEFEMETYWVRDMEDYLRVISQNYTLNYPLTGDLQAELKAGPLIKYRSIFTKFVPLNFETKDIRVIHQLRNFFKQYKGVTVDTRANDGACNNNLRMILEVEGIQYKHIHKIIRLINLQLEANGIKIRVSGNSRSSGVSAPSTLYTQRCDGITITPKNLHDTKPKGLVKYNADIFREVERVLVQDHFKPAKLADGWKPGMRSRLFFKGEHSYTWYANNPLWLYGPTKISLKNKYGKLLNLKPYSLAVDFEEMMNETHITRNQYLFESAKLVVDDIRGSLKSWRNSGGVFALKSPMGTGKSEVLKVVGSMFRRILIITPRRSLADELSSRLGFENYQNRTDASRLVVQYDSLFKVDVSQYQCVILDEAMTLFQHIPQEMNPQDTLANLTKLDVALGCCHVMMLDAMLAASVTEFLPAKRWFWCENSYRDSGALVRQVSLDSLVSSIVSTQGRITISSTSLKFLDDIEDTLESIGRSVVKITAEDDDIQVRKKLDMFNRYLVGALIFSPKLSVGVSIESPVEAHFHYDDAKSADPIQSIQMMRRVRNPKRTEFFVRSRRREETRSFEDFLAMNTKKYNVADSKGNLHITVPGKILSRCQYYSRLWELDRIEAFNMLLGWNFSNVMTQHFQNCATRAAKMVGISEQTHEAIKMAEEFGCAEVAPELRDLHAEDPKLLDNLSNFIQLMNVYDQPITEPGYLASAANAGDAGAAQRLNLFKRAWDGDSKAKEAIAKRDDFLDFGFVKNGWFKSLKPNEKFVKIYRKCKDSRR